MKRRLYNTAVVASLVLFVVVIALWVVSGFGIAALSTGKYGPLGAPFVAQSRGSIGVGWTHLSVYEPGIIFYDIEPFSMFPPMHDETAVSFFGLGYAWDANRKVVGVPHWLLAVLTLILPVVWLIRRRRRRDPDTLSCAKCGYDLRGSSGRACPECGEG